MTKENKCTALSYAKVFRAAAGGWKIQNGIVYPGNDATIIKCTNAAFNSIVEVFENIAKTEDQALREARNG